MSCIILHKHKHDTDYYPANTEEEKIASIKKIYKSNKDMSFYDQYKNKDFKEHMAYLEKQVAYHEELAALQKKYKEDYDVKRTEETINNYKRQAQQSLRYKKIYDMCETGDVKAMEQFLKMRSDYEYEGFEIKKLG